MELKAAKYNMLSTREHPEVIPSYMQEEVVQGRSWQLVVYRKQKSTVYIVVPSG